ncbi:MULTISPECIES: hypothetical protein [Streptomyces]|uniref:Serine protease n=1 Tax=Streptomyces phaeolivaceus TaxID=2653200 RepID=A0A5P8KBB5_9ACTN|nr:hypothetical protein [Streptomyces phaeolivaceus]QFQ99839.1 hypothetical protein F9278_30905 [Streptomyces phaeolivaceus]
MKKTIQAIQRGRAGRLVAAAVVSGALIGLTAATPAQAATRHNLMITNVPSGTNYVRVWVGAEVTLRCLPVQAGKDKNAGVSVTSGSSVYTQSYKECDGFMISGSARSRTVPDNLTTTNYWFSLK